MIDIELVGREVELDLLLESAGAAISGNGTLIFLSGEAGVGKTRLTMELERRLDDQGFKVLRGQCVPESHTPLLAVKEALRTGGLYHIALGAIPPKLLRLYLISDGGLLITEHGREGSNSLDSDILAGMLSAVANFVKDCLLSLDASEAGTLTGMEYGKFKFVLERSLPDPIKKLERVSK